MLTVNVSNNKMKELRGPAVCQRRKKSNQKKMENQMSSTVQSRIYRLLVDLIPELGVSASRTRFAPPRVPGDMAVHCTIDDGVDGHLEIEIAQDIAGDHRRSQSRICFDVDLMRGTACVTQLEQGGYFSVASGRVNVYAANWLAVFHTLGRSFQPIEALACA
ncbi:hypothetical protein [Burkholderia multivorans]|nr:hypothetical protein [Burkholderia multivorans]ELK7722754.1 hypothetical protein [Burkholderia cenocepacia]MBN6738815.1 hypothetical protein [Burkholderia multivorans]MBN7130218.1 hypothetical protein [Burkholderia multivorans]MBN8173386.1 hypothetical protein [Burkholderia multivorans]MBR7896013.1 hypothetical protein [Burkholderia multivorans]